MVSPSFSRPILSVGAVIFRGMDVLLIKRAKPPYQGHWSIPGGKVEHGESLMAALKREILEETGVMIRPIGLIDIFEALPRSPKDRHFIMVDYVAEWTSGEVEAGDDAVEAGFFPYDEALSRLAWDQTRTALQQARAKLPRKHQPHDPYYDP